MRKWLILLLISVLSVSIMQVQAATFSVNNATSLIAAINTANGNGQADVIDLGGNTINLTSSYQTYLNPTGLPSITSNIVLRNGTIDGGNNNFRLLYISGAGVLTIESLNLQNGGGNSIVLGGAIFSASGSTMTIINSTLSGNNATGSLGRGGAIMNSGGTVTVINSTISGNSGSTGSGGRGGAIANFSGTMTVTNSTISGNSAAVGGGIYIEGGTVTVTNSTISGNNASFSGGGINHLFGTLTVNNSTITGNDAANASGGGGGILTADTTTLTNTIIAGNTSTNVGSEDCRYNAGTFTADAKNIFGTNNNSSECSVGASDIVPTGAIGTILNTTLANNGGPTQTHALVGGSPAINASSAGTATDQRGVSAQGIRDIGAFEFGANPTYPLVQFTVANATYNETDGTVNISLSISGAANFSGIAEVYIADMATGTATSGADYATFPLTLVSIDCSAGCPATATINLTINTDTILEPDETVNLAIVGSNGFARIGAQNSYTATIQGQTATVTLSANDPNATENPTDNGQFTLDLGATNGTGSAINITYSISGIATNGTDYTAITGMIGLPNGQQTVTINIVPLDDVIAEGAETVMLTLAATNNGSVSVDTTPASVTIADDEAPNIMIDPIAFTLTIGNSATYDVYLTPEPSADVTITLSQLNANCTINPSTLTFTNSAGVSPWNVPQQITVTGTGANRSTCTIQHTATGGGYTGVTASDVVVTLLRKPDISKPADDPSSDNSPAITVFDPAISKLGLLIPGQVGVQGEQLEWFVTVRNVGNVAGQNVTISDTLVPALRIDSVNAPNATVAITGQTVTVTYPVLNVGETQQFSIITTVLDGVIVNNTACVNADNQGAEECVSANPISQLPNTGETPFWRKWLLLALGGMTVLSIGGIAFVKQHKA